MQNLEGNIFYQRYIKMVWPYWVGAVVLGILNVLLLFVSGRFWSFSSAFGYWGGWLFRKIGVPIQDWAYFSFGRYPLVFSEGFFENRETLLVLSMIIGAFISALAAGEFRIRKIKSYRHVITALIGGTLMGYGARIALGCNIGAYLSAVGSMSLQGWVFGLFTFVGAAAGSKILIKYLM